MVPKASSPRSARARAPGHVVEQPARAWCRRNRVEQQAGLAPEQSARGPRARSASQSRRGAPVLPDDGVVRPARRSRGPTRTVVSRWLVMPMAAMSRARRRRPRRSASRATPSCDAQISSASCSTQPGCGKDLRGIPAAPMADDRAARGRTRWRASWWCPGRGRARISCSSPVVSRERPWFQSGNVRLCLP